MGYLEFKKYCWNKPDLGDRHLSKNGKKNWTRVNDSQLKRIIKFLVFSSAVDPNTIERELYIWI